MTGPGGAASHTGCIFAVITSFRADFGLKHRVSSVIYLHNPVAAIPQGYIVFGLAGYHAVAASHAFFSIESHCVSHDATSFPGFSVRNVTKLPLIPVPPISGSVFILVINWVSLAP